MSPGDWLQVWDEGGEVLFEGEVRARTFWSRGRGPLVEWFHRGLRAQLEKRTPRGAPPYR